MDSALSTLPDKSSVPAEFFAGDGILGRYTQICKWCWNPLCRRFCLQSQYFKINKLNSCRAINGKTSMYRLVYMSTPRHSLSFEELSTILAAATKNNGRDEITGILIQDRKRFLQYLEGEEEQVEQTFARISSDSRHHAIFRLKSGLIDRRQFPGWSMASKTVDESRSLTEVVRELVKNCDRDVATELLNFAEARDRAA